MHSLRYTAALFENRKYETINVIRVNNKCILTVRKKVDQSYTLMVKFVESIIIQVHTFYSIN